MLGGVCVADNPPILFGYQIGIFWQYGGDPPFDLYNVRRHVLEGDDSVGYIGSVNGLNGSCVTHDYLTYIHVCPASESEFCQTGLPNPGNQGTSPGATSGVTTHMHRIFPMGIDAKLCIG